MLFRFLLCLAEGSRSGGREAREGSQRWLMLVTNTIQGGHLRDIRNPIRGFDLHKTTLYRVTRGQRLFRFRGARKIV